MLEMVHLKRSFISIFKDWKLNESMNTFWNEQMLIQNDELY
jgi:hypothetical protein